MKSFIYGFLAIIIVGFTGFYLFRGASNLASRPSPSPVASLPPSAFDTPEGSLAPIATPTPTTVSTTKGGVVKGVSTPTTTTTTTTTSHLLLTLIKTNECKTYTTELKDIQGPLTLRYSLKDGYRAAITAWKQNGEEILSQREITGSGELIRIEGLSYLKLQSQPAQCDSTSDTWLTLTAER